jgi:hypothetical protein
MSGKKIAQKPASVIKANVVKKPACSTAEHVRQMKQGLGDDPDAEEVRDKGKGEKFAKMRGQLPAHILDLYDKEAVTKDIY